MQDKKSRSDQWNPSAKIVQEIIDRYNAGMPARQLAFLYSVADVTITALLKRYGVAIRNRSNARRTSQIKEDVFDTITEESAYWIGFLLADGNVYHPEKRSKQLNIGLAKRDWEHLEKFKKFIGSNKLLYYGKNGVFLSIYSNRIVEKLAEYGIIPRKSKIAEVPEIFKNNRHFWRGMVDGDGWVNHNLLGLCGTLDIVSSFNEFVRSVLSVVSKVNPHQKTECCWEINYSAKYVRYILDVLYGDSHIFLDRKKLLVCGV